MQIFKDGNMLYDSIDNTGTANNASLSAHYAKGRLDTLEGNFNNYFDKTEVLDLLAQKVGAEFVDQLPADLTTNVWYYSKKYADGTTVANDKRALYTKDTNDVIQYLGVMGDVNLTNYQEKQDNMLDTTDKTVVGAINENKAAIDAAKRDGHLYKFNDGYMDSEACVFNFTNGGSVIDTMRVAEKRIFVARMTNPITSSTITGYIETTEFMVPSGPTIYLEQHFYNEQNGNKNNRIEFRRKGNITLDNLAQYTNWVASKQASITWLPWIPTEYPMTSIPAQSFSGAGQINYAYYIISGGMLTFRAYYSASGGLNTEQTIWNLPCDMKHLAGEATSLIYTCVEENFTGAARLSVKNDKTVTIVPKVTGVYRLMAHIPLGY